jgi:hypothetical protein
MYKQASKFILCIASLFLTACGTINNAAIQSLPSEVFYSNEQGVAIFSVGASEPCISFSTAVLVWNGTSHQRVSEIPGIFINNGFQKSDFSDHQGAVNAVTLKPGTYYFQAAGVNPYFQTTSAPTMFFVIAAGETTYIGEIYLPAACATRFKFEIRDNFERDMAIVRQRNPHALARTPNKRIMQFGAPTITEPKANF